MPALNWDIFTSLPGSTEKNFELLCRGIVRQNFGRFRLCYENGLRSNPNLQGRVSVSFTINTDGSVSGVTGSGDLPDSGVVGCVTKAFFGLAFPQPEAGVVKVTYPISFSPAR